MRKNDNTEPDYSRLIKNEAKKYKITIAEKCFADLMAAGWKDKDAYLISGLYNMVYSKEANERDMNTMLMEDKQFRDYLAIARRRAARAKPEKEKTPEEKQVVPEDIDMQSELSKENQLRELLIAKKKLTVGTSEWLKIVQTIADITQAKKDEIQTEDNTIHYYLPLTCSMCELYQKAKKKNKRVRQIKAP